MIWMPIHELEGMYEVSDTGLVRNASTLKQLTCGLCPQGYPIAKMGAAHLGKRYVYRRVHRLVAHAFIPNLNSLPVVNHKDGVKTNNLVRNLEWASHQENSHHAFSTGLTPKKEKVLSDLQLEEAQDAYHMGVPIRDIAAKFGVSRSAIERNIVMSDEGRAKQVKLRSQTTGAKQSKAVRQLDMDGNVMQEFPSLQEAAATVGVRQGNISNVLAGRAKSCGGFKWEKM